MDRISVIIPTWNRSSTLEKAVLSALNQTLPPYEVLVCDDGSTDNSEEIIKAINDPRVLWNQGIHGGRPAIPRNRGIRESQGEWLAFLDSDDEWLPEKLEKQMELVKQKNLKAVCSNALRLIPDAGIQGEYLKWDRSPIVFKDLVQINQVICSSVLIHSSLIPSVIGFPEEIELKTIEDYLLWLRVATFTDFAFVNKPLLIYRDDAANSVRSQDPNRWVQRKNLFQTYLDWINKNDFSYQKSFHKFKTTANKEIRKAKRHLFGRKIKAFLKRN